MFKLTPRSAAKAVALVGALWFISVVVQGLLAAHGWTLIKFDFGLSGEFGDSFGSLSALMAAFAAIGAWEAVIDQRKALELSRKSEDDLRKISAKRDFETTFFNLIDLFERVVSQTDIDRGPSKNPKTGKDAFSFFLERVNYNTGVYENQVGKSYIAIFEKYRSDLAHYYRIMYNIVNYVDKSLVEDKYLYVKILRSILSESELILVALNCHYGEGRDKFSPLLEKYAFLNNISVESRKKYGLGNLFPVGAFEKRNIIATNT